MKDIMSNHKRKSVSMIISDNDYIYLSKNTSAKVELINVFFLVKKALGICEINK